MKCEICDKRIPVDEENICYDCNFVICGLCQSLNLGIPSKRFFAFETYNTVSNLCFNCYIKKKYKRYV